MEHVRNSFNQELVMDINELLSPFIYPHEMDINGH